MISSERNYLLKKVSLAQSAEKKGKGCQNKYSTFFAQGHGNPLDIPQAFSYINLYTFPDF